MFNVSFFTSKPERMGFCWSPSLFVQTLLFGEKQRQGEKERVCKMEAKACNSGKSKFIYDFQKTLLLVVVREQIERGDHNSPAFFP